MSTLHNIEALAEGQLWRDVVGRGRLPASVIEAEAEGKTSYAIGCVEEPLAMKTSEQWREDNPKKGAFHWFNERLVRMRLFEAEVRNGERYLSRDPIVEITPEGWVRGEFGDTIERVEGVYDIYVPR